MPLGAIAFALRYLRDLSKWLPKGTRCEEFLPAGRAANSQGLNPSHICKISIRGCQRGSLLLRCGWREVQRLDTQEEPCTTPCLTWGSPLGLWKVTDSGWVDRLKINLLLDGPTWANTCSSSACIRYECPDPQPHRPSQQNPGPSSLATPWARRVRCSLKIVKCRSHRSTFSKCL